MIVLAAISLNWSLVITSFANLVEVLKDLLSITGGSFVGLSRLTVLSVRQFLLGIVLTIDVDDFSLAALAGALLLFTSAFVVLALVFKLVVFSLVLIFGLCDILLLLLSF